MADSWNDFATKRFFNGEDVKDGPVTVTVKGFGECELETDEGPKKSHTVLVEESEQVILLKPVVRAQFAEIFPRPSQAVGKKIELFYDKSVSMGGKKVGGLRIRPAAGQESGQAAPF